MIVAMFETPLRNALPDAEAAISFPVEELAWLLLQVIHDLQSGGLVCLEQFTQETKNWSDLERPKWGEAEIAICEAWSWLQNNGFLIQAPGQSASYKITSRLADKLTDKEQIDFYRKANLINRNLLHTTIAKRCWPTFVRGDYDTAVFQSFKEVEVAVREAGGYTSRDIGIQLMRRAFDKKTGKLSDMSLPEAERESLAHLFAGAIGSYKNPSSHRTVADIDPQEAAEMMVLASHLLRIVEHRKKHVSTVL